jgi:Flp pilus assembly protein TadG
MVTVETALALPVLVAVAMGLVWLVAMGINQAKCADAAREAARAIARDDEVEHAIALARQSAPAGASIEVDREDGQVQVVVSMAGHPSGPLFEHLPDFHVDASAVAATEDFDAAP